jgi:hypothetical protein
VLPPLSPLLSVEYPNRCTLSKALLAQVPHLKNGGRVLLVPPISRGGEWFLNTLPPPEKNKDGTPSLAPALDMGSRIPERGPALFRVHPLAKAHFMLPQPTLVGPGGRNGLVSGANQNVMVKGLRFQLGAEVHGHRGLYRLIRVQPSGPVNG